ncbi:MAG: HlyD family efflux transporter periplasmic adaptor subunit [Planctomycetes bacterium]|nr:HlyD family efflux transporter periplasmic adaptor subunit [Planctomycetota bacterium]
MSRFSMRLPLAATLLVCLASATLAQEGGDDTLSGRLEALKTTEHKAEFKNFGGELRLKSIAAPGKAVKAGDVLAQLESAEFDRWLARARENAALAELGLSAATDAADQYAVNLPLQLQKAQRDFDRATEALDFFRRKDRQNRIRNSEMQIEGSENSIADQEEELRQLETLYKGNDLAKESQDIVLNRSKRRLKQSKERHEMSKESHKRFVELDIPRIEQDMVAAVESTRNELERLKRLQEKGNIEVQNRLVRARQGAEDARRALADLEADAEAFTIKAAHGGLVMVGGQGGNNSVSAALKAGDKLARGQAVATVVDTSRMVVTVSVPLSQRSTYAVGAAVSVRHGPDTVGTGTVTAAGFLVDAKGRFSVTAEFANNEGKMLPGMKVSLSAQ